MSRLLHSTDIILEEIRRLTGVVEEFLAATRPTRPLRESTSLNRIVEHVAGTLGPDAEASRVELRTALDHDIPEVDADPNQLTQAILNLAKNALEAVRPAEDSAPTPQRDPTGSDARPLANKPRPFVELRTEMVDDACRVRVTDNGPGIAPDVLARIFEPYFTTKPMGTGLGLTIVSRVVEDHGGQLNVASHPGRGTVMTITLPRAGAERRARLIEASPEAQAGTSIELVT